MFGSWQDIVQVGVLGEVQVPAKVDLLVFAQLEQASGVELRAKA